MGYFELIKHGDDEWPYFNGQPTPTSYAPGYYDIFGELELSKQDFVHKANILFQEYNIQVPDNYPNLKTLNRNIFSNIEINPMNDFAICVASCILIREKFNIDVSKIIRNELIENNSRHGILHANSLASIALYYLNKGSKILIPRELNNQYNPDLVINNFSCEVKVIDESDWTQDIDLDTGKGKQRSLSEDLCYDIGQFISKRDSGHKGIKQSDIIFADLSLKSFGWIENIVDKKKPGFPNLKKYMIIYFAKKITDISSYYLEFDPLLWELIKTTKSKHSFSILPWSKKTN